MSDGKNIHHPIPLDLEKHDQPTVESNLHHPGTHFRIGVPLVHQSRMGHLESKAATDKEHDMSGCRASLLDVCAP